MPADIATLADEYYEFTTEIYPTTAHMRGDYRFIDRFENQSRDAEDDNIRRYRAFADRATSIDPSTLDADGITSRETLIFLAETNAALIETRQAEFGVDPIFGLHVSLPMLAPRWTVETPEHAEAIVDKYRGVAAAYRDMSDRLRQGVAHQRTSAEFAAERVVSQLDDILSTDVADDPLLESRVPPAFDEAQMAAWKDRLAGVVEDEIRPAMMAYRDVISDEVMPNVRPNDRAGVSALHDGEVLYARAVHFYTTLPMEAREVHEIGLQQIDRLTSEYRDLGGQALGTSDLDEIYSKLRDDPALHHTSGRDVVTASEQAFEKARAEMPNWFGRMPKSDCLVEETQTGPVAFYFPPAEDGSREGTFFMNTADPTSWGTFEIESTSFHEGIPGHHLQIAIAQELGDAVPAFRRNAWIPAYGEGWGLYTERLADEMGLYSSPLDRIGMLSADSMRACRLVVDTGMHALGWSRQEAVDYMVANSPMALHSITEEVDRYIVLPGQALAYMVGRLEIQRIRADAEARLGDRFDIKGFHDIVLGSGLVPLETLDRLVGEWAATG